jgi:hypothetical protein
MWVNEPPDVAKQNRQSEFLNDGRALALKNGPATLCFVDAFSTLKAATRNVPDRTPQGVATTSDRDSLQNSAFTLRHPKRLKNQGCTRKGGFIALRTIFEARFF